MRDNINKYKLIYLQLMLLILGLIVNVPMLSYLILLIISLITFLSVKDSLIFLLIYTPTRPFIIDIVPEFKALGDAIIISSLLKIILEHMKAGEFKNLFKLNIIEWSFLLFCLVGSISAYLTGVSLKAIIFQNRAFLIFFLLFYIIRRMEIKKSDIHKFLWVTFTTAFVLSVHGLIEKVSLRSMLLPEGWEGAQMSWTNFYRIYSLMWEPNILGLYLLMAVIFTIYLIKEYKNGFTKYLLYTGQVLFLSVYYFTYSRGSYLAGILFFIIFILFNWRKLDIKKWIKPVITVVAVTIVFIVSIQSLTNYIEDKYYYTLYPEYKEDETDKEKEEKPKEDRLRKTFTKEELENSLQYGRLGYIKKGFEIFQDHPIIGTGFATYGDSATKSFSSPIYEEYGISWNFFSDSQYIQIIVQTGIVGVIIFAIYLLSIVFYTWKKDKILWHVPIITFLVFSAGLCGFYYNIWESDSFTLYFFIVLGFYLSTKNMKEGYIANEKKG